MKRSKYTDADLLRVANYIAAMKKYGLEDTLHSQGKELNRLTNAWTDLFTELNRAGLDEGQVSALQALTGMIKGVTPYLAGFTAGMRQVFSDIRSGYDRISPLFSTILGGVLAYRVWKVASIIQGALKGMTLLAKIRTAGGIVEITKDILGLNSALGKMILRFVLIPVAIGAAIIAFQDLLTYMKGGDSVIGSFAERDDEGILGFLEEVAAFISVIANEIGLGTKKIVGALHMLVGALTFDKDAMKAGYDTWNDASIEAGRRRERLMPDLKGTLGKSLENYTPAELKAFKEKGTLAYESYSDRKTSYEMYNPNAITQARRNTNVANTPSPTTVTNHNTFHIDGSKDPQAIADKFQNILDNMMNNSITNYTTPNI